MPDRRLRHMDCLNPGKAGNSASLHEIPGTRVPTTEENRAQRSVAEHVEWCREERDRLAAELAEFEAGAKSLGEPQADESMSRGSLTRIAYLRRNIEQLGRVIGAYPEVPIVPPG